MATIVHTQSGNVVHLLPYHSFGRKEDAVSTDAPFLEISKLHATIKWMDNNWYIEDFSTNGTQLNGKPLPKSQAVQLEVGQRFNLAGLASASWDILDMSPPASQLISLKDPSKTLILDSYNLLPNEEAPVLAIYKDTLKNVYLCQTLTEGNSATARILKHGENLLIGNELWQCFLPVLDEQTVILHADSAKLADLSLTIELSQDEETVAMRLQGRNTDADFGAKAHHYLVCHLARKKQKDTALGLDAKEQGWIDTSLLCTELGLEETHLNVQIYRIRSQINKALESVVDIDSFIQRRSGSIRLGIAASNISVNKGEAALS